MHIFSNSQKIATIRNEKGIGAPALCAWQRGSGNFLALRFEGIFAVLIYDRQGRIYKKISIPANCTGLEWDADGDVLAILVDTPGVVVLWEAHSGKVLEVETGLKDTGTVISWSAIGKVLGYGTLKGSIMVYNHQSLRKIPVVGKHTKKIVCAKWSKDEILAFGTLDDQVSLNTTDGDLLRYLQLRGKPMDLQFGHIKEDHAPNSTSDNTVSCIVGEKTLYLLKFDDTNATSPMELGFQSRYGNILSHHWHGDGYILVSFMGGFVVLLSSHYKEIGTELVLCELKEDILRHCSINVKCGWLALCCGQSTVQIHEAAEPKIILSLTEVQDDEGRLRPVVKCHWAEDGQLLAVCNTAGDVMIFLTSVPMLGGANFNQLAAMSSLTDCVLYSLVAGQIVPEFTYTLQMEPNRIVLGPIHLAAVIHSSVLIFNTRGEMAALNCVPIVTKEFNSNVHECVLNHLFLAVRCGDKAFLHRIEGNGLEKFDVKTFPETSAKGFKVTSIAMAKESFMYGGENGVVKMFHMEQWTEIMSIEIPSSAPVKGLFPDPTGGQCVIMDKHNTGYYFDVLTPSTSEVNGTMIRTLKNFPHRCDGILWDSDFNSRHIFLAFAGNTSKVELYSGWKDMSKGTDVDYVGQYDIFKHTDYRPFCIKKGFVFAFTGTGKITKAPSLYQEGILSDGGTEDKDELLKRLVNLRQFNEACDFCSDHKNPDHWTYLAKAALETGQLDIAIKAYQKLGNIGMVCSLRRISNETDELDALLGDVAFIMGEFDTAESRYLETGQYDKALTMRRDLHEWSKAMTIAEKFNSPLLTDISREYAAVAEYNNDTPTALTLYKKANATFVVLTEEELALMSEERQKSIKDKKLQIEKGLARNLIRNGMYHEAMDIVNASESVPFKHECAEIFEDQKEYKKAAKLYEKSDDLVKAASCHIRLKDYAKAQTFLRIRSSPKVWRQLGKAKEADDNLVEAASAYSEGFDVENGIRLYLQLGIPEEAGSLAKRSDDPNDAVKVARYYQEMGELEKALEYLILSECYSDALLEAFKHGKQEFYADFIYTTFGREIPKGFYEGISSVANDFESKKDNFRAGKCYQYIGEFDRSFTVLMKAANSGVQVNEEDLMKRLTDTVIGSGNEGYARQLIEFFLGEKDGVPKEPRYLYNYYLNAGKIVEASKTAIIVARAEQDLENYKEAHLVIVQSITKLKSINEKIPKDMIDMFNTLHSYKLLRLLMEGPSKLGAARMVMRLFDNLSQFSKVAVHILTTGLTLCQQVNMKESARQIAFALIKDHRGAIDLKYKPLIEQMVRKTAKTDYTDEVQKQAPCPYCENPVDEYALTCKDCRSLIPMCCVSGKHTIADDFCICPHCEFPFILSELKYVKKCPVCSSTLHSADKRRINDPTPFLYDGVKNTDKSITSSSSSSNL